MAFEKLIDTSILDKVMHDYKKISEAFGGVRNDADLYKSIDSRTGDIFLIRNPDVWMETTDEKGRHFRVRPAPRLAMTYEEAKRAAVATTASFVREQRNQSAFERM